MRVTLGCSRHIHLLPHPSFPPLILLSSSLVWFLPAGGDRSGLRLAQSLYRHSNPGPASYMYLSSEKRHVLVLNETRTSHRCLDFQELTGGEIFVIYSQFAKSLGQRQHALQNNNALYGMQTRSSDENSGCLSVCPSNAYMVTNRKKNQSRFLYRTKDHVA